VFASKPAIERKTEQLRGDLPAAHAKPNRKILTRCVSLGLDPAQISATRLSSAKRNAGLRQFSAAPIAAANIRRSRISGRAHGARRTPRSMHRGIGPIESGPASRDFPVAPHHRKVLRLRYWTGDAF